MSRWFSWSLLILAVCLAAGVRVRLLDFPLERDEGEYAYAGQLIDEGVPPYKLAYNMKMPGTYLAYAALMALFGETTRGIHLGLLWVHLATLAVLFRVARKVLDLPGAAVATAGYALLTLSPAYFGLAAHATHFVVLPAMLGVGMLLRDSRAPRLSHCLLAGGCFGVAFLMKQQGVFFGIFGGLWLGWTALDARWPRGVALARLGAYAAGCGLPFLLVCLWLARAGVFAEFWFWTITYAREYVTLTPFQAGLDQAKSALGNILAAAPGLWLLAGLGLACLGIPGRPRNDRVFLGVFLLFSLLAVTPGLYFRGHYFIVLAPAVALLAGLAVSNAARWLAERSQGPAPVIFPLGLAALACVHSAYAGRSVFFTLTPEAACRQVYNVAPFPEAPEIARYIAQHSGKDERIAVIGSEPEIYFDARRRSATGYIYAYPLMEDQPFARTMQANMIRELVENPPAFLVLVSIPNSWTPQQDSSHQLLDWVTEYLDRNMRQVGLVQHTNDAATESIWGPSAATAPLKSTYYVAVFQPLRSSETNLPNFARDRAEAAARNKLLMDRFYRGQDNALIFELQEMVRHHPGFALAHESLGNLFARQGELDTAVHEYELSLNLQPTNWEAHYNLGGVYLRQGQTDAAIQEFEATARLSPDDADVHFNLGKLLLGKRQVAAAINEFRLTTQLRPDDAIARNNLGLLLQAIGRNAEAVSEFQAAARLLPDNAQVQNNLAKALAAKGAPPPPGKP